MDIHIKVTVGLDPSLSGALPDLLGPALDAFGERLMSKISDAIKAAGDSADAAIARVQGDLTVLRGQVADLQSKVDQGLASDADVAALADLKTKLDTLDPSNPATLPADATGGTPAPDATSATGTTDDPAARFSPAPDATS